MIPPRDEHDDVAAAAAAAADEEDTPAPAPAPAPALQPAAADRAAPAPPAAATPDPLDSIVSQLSQNPELIALVERSVASLSLSAGGSAGPAASSNTGSGIIPSTAAAAASATAGSANSTDEVTRRVVRSVLLERLGAGGGDASSTGAVVAAPAPNPPAVATRSGSSRPTAAATAAGARGAEQPANAANAAPNAVPNVGNISSSSAQQQAYPSVPAAASAGASLGGTSVEGAGSSGAIPPVKTVTFSTISVPDALDNENSDNAGEEDEGGVQSPFGRRDSNEDYDYDGEVDGEGIEAMRRSRGRSASPPPPQFPSLLQDSYHYPNSSSRHDNIVSNRPAAAGGATGGIRGRSRSPTTTLSLGMSSVTSAEYMNNAASSGGAVIQTGENTASGDESSVTSVFSRGSRSSRGSRNASVTFAPGVSFGSAAGGTGTGTGAAGTSSSGGASASSSTAHVHFSAMNPNPHLMLDGAASPPPREHTTADGQQQDGPTTGAAALDNVSNGAGPRVVSFQTDGIRLDNDDDGNDEAPTARVSSVLAERVVGRAATASARSRSRSRSPPPPPPDRGVSWEDDAGMSTPPTANAGGSSRGSRSGLSSPAIEPSLSPISASSRSRRSGSIQFNNEISVIDTITEAADRLRRQEGQEVGAQEGAGNAVRNVNVTTSYDDDPEGPHSPPGSDIDVEAPQPRPAYQRTSSGRVVHFSALRDVAVVDTDAVQVAGSIHSGGIVATEQAQAAAAAARNRPPGSSAVHFADETAATDGGADLTDAHAHHLPAEGLPGQTTTFQSESDLERAADRLRRLIRRAEAVGNTTLEEAFGHFDPNHSGTITPVDLRDGLARLGESFASYSVEDCTALIEYWSRTSTGSACMNGQLTLLGFFRAMGRHSPPLMPSDTDGGDGDNEEKEEEEEGVGDGVQYGQQTYPPIRPAPQRRHVSDLAESPVVHAHEAANRLREIVLRAEREEGRRLERSFRMLDPDNNGYVNAEDFRRGLRRLGRGEEGDAETNEEDGKEDENMREREEITANDAFSSIDDEDCEELVALFDANNDGFVSLLDFYRFMGRHSPPPETAAASGSSGEEGDGDDEVDDADVIAVV